MQILEHSQAQFCACLGKGTRLPATGLWDSGYQDLLELVDLPTLECRRLET